MKQIEVNILGHSYVLGCPPGGETSLLEAVTLVDREMSSIREAGKVKSRERIAVLAALNLAFQLVEDLALQNPAQLCESKNFNINDEEITALIARIDRSLQEEKRAY